jgi:hypothetical protein
MRMRDLYWFVGAAGIAANFFGGCSNSSSGGSYGSGSASGSGEDATVPDASADAHCVVDADLSFVTTVDAAGAECAVCLVDMCQMQVRDCETDCLCSYYFACVAYLAGDAGYNAFITCAGDANQTAALASNHAFSELYSCSTTTCKNVCVPAVDAGVDAAGGG